VHRLARAAKFSRDPSTRLAGDSSPTGLTLAVTTDFPDEAFVSGGASGIGRGVTLSADEPNESLGAGFSAHSGDRSPLPKKENLIELERC
jgi:hypothetical protein